MDLWLAVILAYLAEELLHLACGLVHINNFARLPAHAGPHVGNLARNENGLTGAHAKSLITNLKFKLAIDDVDPLILAVVEVARPAASAGEFENAHCAIRVPCRDLTIMRFAAELDSLIESVFPRADAEAQKHLLTLHFLGSFQVLDGFVDGFNQRLRSGEVLLQNLPVRLQGSNFFEIGSAQDSFDLLQLEPQLPVEQDLLEGQELCLLVEPVAIRPVIGGLQQARLIVEMKRAHADARHRGQLLDCVSHRFFSAETTLVPTATLQSRGSRNVRVKRKRKKIWEERWIMPDNIECPDRITRHSEVGRVAQAFDLFGITTTVDAPSLRLRSGQALRVLCEGRESEIPTHAC